MTPIIDLLLGFSASAIWGWGIQRLAVASRKPVVATNVQKMIRGQKNAMDFGVRGLGFSCTS